MDFPFGPANRNYEVHYLQYILDYRLKSGQDLINLALIDQLVIAAVLQVIHSSQSWESKNLKVYRVEHDVWDHYYVEYDGEIVFHFQEDISGYYLDYCDLSEEDWLERLFNKAKKLVEQFGKM